MVKHLRHHRYPTHASHTYHKDTRLEVLPLEESRLVLPLEDGHRVEARLCVLEELLGGAGHHGGACVWGEGMGGGGRIRG